MMNTPLETGRRWATAALAAAALLSGAYWAEALLRQWRAGSALGPTSSKAESAVVSSSAPSTPSAPSAPSAAGAADTADTTGSKTRSADTPSAEALASLLGAPAALAAPGPADRFKVLGVIASPSGQGVALLAVDGQPPKPYRVGSELAPGFVLRSVSPQEIALGSADPDSQTITLAVPQAESSPAPSNAAPAPDPSAGARADGKPGDAGPPVSGGTRSAP